MKDLRIGMIGLDTSHCTQFARILNDLSYPLHVSGGRVTVAWPGGTPDFEKSISRVEGYTRELREQFGVNIVDSPEQVAEQCDGILMTAVDGRRHVELFRRIAGYGKPVFIDKPFTTTAQDAEEIARLGREHGVVWMSSAPVRFSRRLQEAAADSAKGGIVGADAFGPLKFEAALPGWFWYGIHTVEALYTIMGRGCEEVRAHVADGHDVVVGRWKDGRIGTARGNHGENSEQGAFIHRVRGTDYADLNPVPVTPYRYEMESALKMFRERRPSIDERDSIEIVRFIEAANESRTTGRAVKL